MKKNLINILKFTVYLAIGACLMWFVYHKYDMQKIKDAVSGNLNIWWLILSLITGLLSHMSRTIRWQMIIEPIAKRTNTTNTFFAVMIGYFANLLIPRMGEISRCGVLSRYEKISMSKLIGTVVVERLVDVICLFICLILVFVLQYNAVANFLSKNTNISKFTNLFSSIWTYFIIACVVVLFIMFRKRFKRTTLYHKFSGLWSKFAEGFLAIKNLKNKWRFIAHSVFIWFMYFLMIYFNFFAFDFTSNLTPLAGLTVFVLGSLGMVAPVQGGMGPWHFMVIASLQIYGISKIDGAAFALIVWSSLNMMIVFLGIISLIIMPIINKKRLQTESNKVN